MPRKRTEEGPLGIQEGKPVTESRIEIPGAAGGLQDSMAFDPVKLLDGEVAYVVLRLQVAKVRFEHTDPKDLASPMRRVHICVPVDEYGNRGAGAMLIGAEQVETGLREHADRMRKLRDEAAGIMTLPDIDGEPGPVGDEYRSTGGGEDEDGYYDPAAGDDGYPEASS